MGGLDSGFGAATGSTPQGNTLLGVAPVRHLSEAGVHREQAAQDADPSTQCHEAIDPEQVAEAQQEERNPQRQEYEPQRSVKLEGADPHVEGEYAPHDQRHSNGRGPNAELCDAKEAMLEQDQQRKPPPEGTVTGECDGAEGISFPILQQSCKHLDRASKGNRQRDDCQFKVRTENAGIYEAQENGRHTEPDEAKRGRIRGVGV